MAKLTYYTLGRYVCLGRVPIQTRENAMAAGLIIITASEYRKRFYAASSSERIAMGGVWHDTVMYY